MWRIKLVNEGTCLGAVIIGDRMQPGFVSPINVFTMSHFDYPNCKLIVLDGIDDAIPSLTESKSFSPRQLFATQRSWVLDESFNTFQDLLQIPLGYCSEVFLNRSLEKDLICGHLSLAF